MLQNPQKYIIIIVIKLIVLYHEIKKQIVKRKILSAGQEAVDLAGQKIHGVSRLDPFDPTVYKNVESASVEQEDVVGVLTFIGGELGAMLPVGFIFEVNEILQRGADVLNFHMRSPWIEFYIMILIIYYKL